MENTFSAVKNNRIAKAFVVRVDDWINSELMTELIQSVDDWIGWTSDSLSNCTPIRLQVLRSKH